MSSSEMATARRCWSSCDPTEIRMRSCCTVRCSRRSARPFSPQKEAPGAVLSPAVMPEAQEMATSDADGADVLGTAGHSGPIGLAMIAAAAEHASPFSSELRVPLTRHAP